MTTQEESYLRAVQATLLERLRGLLGTSYDDPILQIKHVIGSVYGQNSCYGLFIYGEKHPVPAQEQDTSYTFIVRIGHDHCRSDHYLYIRVDMELFNGSWLIHAVAVTCRRIPGDYRSNDTLCEDIHDVKLTIGQIQRGIRGTSQCICDKMEFLGATIFNIWCIMK